MEQRMPGDIPSDTHRGFRKFKGVINFIVLKEGTGKMKKLFIKQLSVIIPLFLRSASSFAIPQAEADADDDDGWVICK